MMGIDDDLVTVLRDLVQFLETLCDVNLPNSLENVRDNLLRRSRSSLAAHEPISISPEPYLDMKAGMGKGLILPKLEIPNDANLTEYIDADNQLPSTVSSSCQNDYESFGNVPAISQQMSQEKDEADERIKTIYRSFTAEQTRSKCHKCGPLHLKGDGRYFGNFGKLKSCWVGLVGTHLLIYSSKDAKQPTKIFSIRGYSGRPAPSLLPRDPQRAKSAFEVFSPGCKTWQFVARVPKDMEQWTAAINRVGCSSQSDKSPDDQDSSFEQLVPSIDATSMSSEEQYQDIGQLLESTMKSSPIKESKVAEKIDVSTNEKLQKTSIVSSPPPLPARIPRRLPSLPQEPTPTYPEDETDEKDDLYHTIEDLKEQTTYQNLQKPNQVKIGKSIEQKPELEMYDDIQVNGVKSDANSPKKLETQDEVNLTESTKEETTRDSPKKKSFFDRVRSKKESPKKDESKKKGKMKNSSELLVASERELPTYDDVFDVADSKCDKNNEEIGNYTCPPAPRPFNPPQSLTMEEEFYDDIGHIRANERVESSLNNVNCEMEHYQVPRARESIDLGQLSVTNSEELYDDVAILAKCRARKRDSECSSSSSSEKTVNNVAKAWNRFASGKKNHDKNSTKYSKSDELVETSVDNIDDGSDLKINKFQKLINKMEYSLSKNGKPPMPPIINKIDGN